LWMVPIGNAHKYNESHIYIYMAIIRCEFKVLCLKASLAPAPPMHYLAVRPTSISCGNSLANACSPEGLSCPRCVRTFDSSPAYVDLTLTSGLKPKVYEQRAWGGTELFR